MFRGSPREAAVGFPANLNVAVSVSLAGIGPDRTTLEIWADPALERNIHRVEVDSDSASFSMEIQNIPSANPKTGRITAQSVIAALRKLTGPLRGHLSTLAAACSGTSTPPGAAAFPPSAPPTTCPSHPAPAGGYGTHPASLDAPR